MERILFHASTRIEVEAYNQIIKDHVRNLDLASDADYLVKKSNTTLDTSVHLLTAGIVTGFFGWMMHSSQKNR